MGLKTILVGSHFVPPAKLLLQALPSEARVELRPEPDNPYDPLAIKVFVDPSEINADALRLLEEPLAASGFSIDEVVNSPEVICLGHVAATDGKPLAKASAASGLKLVGTTSILNSFAKWAQQVTPEPLGARLLFQDELFVIEIEEPK